MNRTLPLFFIAACCSGLGLAQDNKIYRCGNEYTNNSAMAQQRGCKLIEGGNITVVEGIRPSAPATSAARAASAALGPSRVEAAEQRSRDADARGILEAELRRAEARLAELQKEYNNGEPERRGDESRNYQKYLDRVADLKAGIARVESDVASIKREIARLPASK